MVASALFVLVSSGCTGGSAPPTGPSTAAPPSGGDPGQAGAWSLDDVRTDEIPAAPRRAASKLPPIFPADDAVLPDLLADPPGRVRIAYHPPESFDDVGGWSTERVFFYGLDGSWRSLEMVDLGLSESSHPGVDTYGAGYLSPDGASWAARSGDGLVLMDLTTAESEVVELPGTHTAYLGWRPDGRRLDVVRFSGLRTYRTWTIEMRTLRASRAPYSLPLSGYAHDGSVVTFGKRGGGTIRTVHRDARRETVPMPVPPRLVRSGGAVGPERTILGLRRELVAIDNESSSPVARLGLRRTDDVGYPHAWRGREEFWFSESTRGVLTWNVIAGEIRTLVHVRPPARPDTYWSASVATDLIG